MSSRGHISGSLLKTVIDVAEKKNVSREDLLNDSGLTDQDLDSSGFRLPTQLAKELMHEIIKRADDQSFGLQVGRDVKPGSLNSLGYALMSSQNMEEALKIQKAFGGIITDSAELKIDFKDQYVIVSFTVEGDDPETVRPLNDMFMSTIWNYSNWITRTEGKLHAITFTHAEPVYIEAYKDVFGVEPEFDQDACSFVFDKKYLKDPLYQADASLNAVMQERAQTELDKAKSHISVYAAAAYHIRKLLPVQKATLIMVAEQLNMSERSLSRKLKDEGYSFKAVLQSVRETLAFEYLKNQEVSVTDIANKLGYRDYSAFSHAFRSWTGYSPKEFREFR